MTYLTMKRVNPPAWVKDYARHVITHKTPLTAEQQCVLTQLQPLIYKEIDKRANQFANDSEQCFIGEDAINNFPEKIRLDGQYYIADESYYEIDETSARLFLMLHCLEDPTQEFLKNQVEQNYDYLGLEAIIEIDWINKTFVIDEGFNTSSI